MVGRQNFYINLEWAAVLLKLRTTALECHVLFEWPLKVSKIHHPTLRKRYIFTWMKIYEKKFWTWYVFFCCSAVQKRFDLRTKNKSIYHILFFILTCTVSDIMLYTFTLKALKEEFVNFPIILCQPKLPNRNIK